MPSPPGQAEPKEILPSPSCLPVFPHTTETSSKRSWAFTKAKSWGFHNLPLNFTFFLVESKENHLKVRSGPFLRAGDRSWVRVGGPGLSALRMKELTSLCELCAQHTLKLSCAHCCRLWVPLTVFSLPSWVQAHIYFLIFLRAGQRDPDGGYTLKLLQGPRKVGFVP